MADEILLNKRIDQLDLGIPRSGDFLVFRDMTNSKTKRCLADDFLSSASNNIEWLSDTAYVTNDIVTYAGKIWQALGDNTNVIPGTNGLVWNELTKGVVWARWAAGTFLEDDVFVIREIDGEDHIVKLIDATRPYNSTDFVAEYAAGDWISITQNVIEKSATLAAGTLQVDLNLLKKRNFYSAAINEAKVWSLLKGDNLKEMKISFEMTTLVAQTFPATFIVNSLAGVWDGVAKTWTPYDVGKYIMEVELLNGVHYAKIFGPYY